MHVLVSILCGSERTGWVNPALCRWILAQCPPPAGIGVEFSFETGNTWPVSHARNVAVQRGLNLKADWILQIDNDAVPPADFLSLLKLADARNLDFIAAASPILRPNHDVQINVLKRLEHPEIVDDLFEEVAEVGGGCFAVRAKAFESLLRPYFRIEPNLELVDRGLGDCVGEDVAFCRALRATGVKLFVLKNQACWHFKTTNLLTMFAQLNANGG
jgi:GT2 family glycosyltransferase